MDLQQQIRLFFPLIVSRQLITGVNTAYRQEINKLRQFGLKYIQPELTRLKFRKYPYKLSFIFYSSTSTDMISILTMVVYILHLFENYATLQSTDCRVIPEIDIHTEVRKTNLFTQEGCEIIFESVKPEKYKLSLSDRKS